MSPLNHEAPRSPLPPGSWVTVDGVARFCSIMRRSRPLTQQPSGPDASPVETKSHSVVRRGAPPVGCCGQGVMPAACCLLLAACCLMCVPSCSMPAGGSVHGVRVVKLRAPVASFQLQGTVSRSVFEAVEKRHLGTQEFSSRLEFKSIRPASPQQCSFT